MNVAAASASSNAHAGRLAGLPAAMLVGGAFLVPLVMRPPDEAFALPKLIALGVLTGGLLVATVVSRWPTFLPSFADTLSPVTHLLLAYVALTLLATALSSDAITALIGLPYQYQGLGATLVYAAGFTFARTFLGTGDWTARLAIAVVASAVLMSLYGFAQQAGLDPWWHTLIKGRIFSTIGQANAFGAFLVLALPLGVALAMTHRGYRRLGAVVASAAIFCAILLTLSRGAYLGTAVSACVFGALVLRRRRCSARAIGLVAAVLVVTAVTTIVVPPINHQAGRIVARASAMLRTDKGSGAKHLDLWAVGIRIAADHPVFGVGPDMYLATFPLYRDVVLPADRAASLARYTPESPHSVPIAIADGAGLPALFAYAAMVALALAAGVRRLRHPDTSPADRLLAAALLAAVVGHLVTDLFMTADVTGSWLAWVFLGVLAFGPRRVIERVPSAKVAQDRTMPG